jgi:8-oxo-dGTP pyrophosphatase MutT (NUDIX family)
MDYISWIRSKVGHENIILVAAGVIVFDEDGRVLLQNRSKTEERWGFPGGMLELGETVAETAVRELYEETGLEVEISAFQGIYSNFTAHFDNGDIAQTIAVVFQGKAIGGQLTIDKVETFDLRFFYPEEAPKLFNQQHQDMLEDTRQQKLGVFH